MYLRNAIMETKDSSEKTNTGQSLRETVWKKNGCYWFTFWRDLNMVEKKGWFRSKRLRQSLWQGSGYTYLGNVRSTGIDSVSFLWGVGVSLERWVKDHFPSYQAWVQLFTCLSCMLTLAHVLAWTRANQCQTWQVEAEPSVGGREWESRVGHGHRLM